MSDAQGALRVVGDPAAGQLTAFCRGNGHDHGPSPRRRRPTLRKYLGSCVIERQLGLFFPFLDASAPGTLPWWRGTLGRKTGF